MGTAVLASQKVCREGWWWWWAETGECGEKVERKSLGWSLVTKTREPWPKQETGAFAESGGGADKSGKGVEVRQS